MKNDVRTLVIIPWLIYLKNLKNLLPIVSNGISIEYLCYFYLPGLARVSAPAFLSFSLFFKFFKIKKYKPDCLLLSWAYPDAVSGMFLAKKLKIPAVIKVHGSDINIHGLYPLRARQIVWAMNNAQRVITVSKALATRLIEMGVSEEKIQVIYNGVDRTIFNPLPVHMARINVQLKEESNNLLYIGNLKEEKGCLDLLEAFRIISSQYTDLTLYYIGTGNMADEIDSRAREYGLSERIKRLGSLPHKDLVVWINACNLVVLPSYNEGVPNVLLEAMACGVPVVASKVGGIPEVVPNYAGILHDHGNIDSLSNALKMGLDRVWDRDKIVSANIDLSWKNNIKQLQEVMQAAVNS